MNEDGSSCQLNIRRKCHMMMDYQPTFIYAMGCICETIKTERVYSCLYNVQNCDMHHTLMYYLVNSKTPSSLLLPPHPFPPFLPLPLPSPSLPLP